MKHRFPCTSALFGFVIFLLALAQAPVCSAQDVATAVKGSDLSAFAGYDYADPAYGPDHNHGASFGLNFTRYFPGLHVDPSIEGRINLTNGADVKERTYLGGLQAKTTFFHHYHPYADFLVGSGIIHFNTTASGYTSDNSVVYNYGAGIDIDLIRRFQFRADYQRQAWSLDRSTNFNPNILLFGVNYTIPFRDYKKQADLNP